MCDKVIMNKDIYVLYYCISVALDNLKNYVVLAKISKFCCRPTVLGLLTILDSPAILIFKLIFFYHNFSFVLKR